MQESREIVGLELRWQEILGAGASSLRAERMPSQELARPRALGGQPFSPIRRRKCLADTGKQGKELKHRMGRGKAEQL